MGRFFSILHLSIFLLALGLGQMAMAQPSCLKENPQVLSATNLAEYRLADLIRRHQRTFSSSEIAELKSCMNEHNATVEAELAQWRNQKLDWDAMWNTWLEISDAGSIEKEMDLIQQKLESLKEKLRQDLKSIPNKGLYLCLLYDLDAYAFSATDLQNLAKEALAPKAIEEFNGHLIESIKKISTTESGQSFLSQIKDQVSGEIKVSDILLAKRSKEKTAFILIAQLEITHLNSNSPTTKSLNNSPKSKQKALVVNGFKLDEDMLNSIAAYEAEWPHEIRSLLSGKSSDFSSALDRAAQLRKSMIENALNGSSTLSAEWQSLNERRKGKLNRQAQLQQKLNIPSSGNPSEDVHRIQHQLMLLHDNLYQTYLSIKSKELLARFDIEISGERSMPEEIGTQSKQVVEQLAESYGKTLAYQQVNEVVQGDYTDQFRQSVEKGKALYRELDKVWLFQEKQEHGWRISVVTQFRLLPQESKGPAGQPSAAGVQIEWVRIPGGRFLMGSPATEMQRMPNEGPQREVEIAAFTMSKYEITFDQYDRFCEETEREKPGDAGWGRGNMPVINVSWDDAKAFAKWLGGRLPTEAEWEYACRAGGSGPFGHDSCLDTKKANYDGMYPYFTCPKGKTSAKSKPVGQFSPNRWGLHDTHGNVLEWCEDWFSPSYYSLLENNNPKGPEEGFEKVLRGGSWFFRARNCRAAARYSEKPTNKSNTIGFRVVLPD